VLGPKGAVHLDEGSDNLFCTVLEPSDLAIFLFHSLPSVGVAPDCAAGHVDPNRNHVRACFLSAHWRRGSRFSLDTFLRGALLRFVIEAQ
jgi:hypothetical protein